MQTALFLTASAGFDSSKSLARLSVLTGLQLKSKH